MSRQGTPPFSERVQRAVVAADKLAAERSDRTAARSWDAGSSPEHQELVRLKVILEVETSRALTEAARVSAQLERSSLAEKISSVRAER